MNPIAFTQRALRKAGLLSRLAPSMHERVVELEPAGKVRGRILLAYVLDPFLRPPAATISRDHTHHWESWQIAQTFLERGFRVDVISYLNRRFAPSHAYDIFFAARTNFQRLSEALHGSCRKVVHLDTAHWLFNNTAAYQRLLDLQRRRGVTLNNIKMVEANWAIEHADLGTVLGNDFTVATYRYAGKPLHRIPISATEIYPWDDAKSFDSARRRFLWFGSSGFVHKGLDLVLEAFARMPEMELVVCGPFAYEQPFLEAFHRELFETPNIRAVGWVDVASDQFREIARGCAGLVYPSCSEGGGGSAITCMQAGIIPIVSFETSVDIGDGGIILRENAIDAICTEVQGLAARSAADLEEQAREAWRLARSRHTREKFAATFSEFVERELIGG